MNQREWGEAVAQTKVDALGQLCERGYRVVAAVDNEPENLEFTDFGADVEGVVPKRRTLRRRRPRCSRRRRCRRGDDRGLTADVIGDTRAVVVRRR